VIDDYTVEVNLDKSDRLAAPNIAGMLAPIYNSKLAKEHATEADPWATEWLNNNDAGSGAYYVESFRSGEEVILRRNEEWKGGRNGELPFFKRILFHTVPDATTRASLIERGDADISIDLRPTDIETLANAADISVVSVPQSNAFTMVAFNTKMPPFDNKLVRQALAFALPFDALYEAALAKRGLPLFGATWEGRPSDPGFPQPLPFRQDLEKAKALLKEAGFADGFKTTFTYNISSAGVSEPMAALIKEAFEKVGVMVEIQKLPDSQMAEALTAKTIPFFTETSSANLPSTDYFFRIFLQGETRWNYSSWSNPEIARLTESARYEVDDAKYDEAAIEMIRLFVDEAPMIMLWQANQDAVMRKDVKGFTYWYHRQLDYRDLRRDGQ
jgi:peptide/nickel transport system substrate-binding protein